MACTDIRVLGTACKRPSETSPCSLPGSLKLGDTPWGFHYVTQGLPIESGKTSPSILTSGHVTSSHLTCPPPLPSVTVEGATRVHAATTSILSDNHFRRGHHYPASFPSLPPDVLPLCPALFALPCSALHPLPYHALHYLSCPSHLYNSLPACIHCLFSCMFH